MPITQKTTAGKSRLEQRRERLQMQHKRRIEAAQQGGATPVVEDPAPAADGAGGGAAAGAGFGAMAGGGLQHIMQKQMNDVGKEKMEFRQKMLMNIYKILTTNAGGGAEQVKGTPFTVEGVEKMMGMLRERAANEGQNGAAMAGGFINYLKPTSDDQPAVSGASVEKLQLVARMASQNFAPGGPK